MKKIDELKQLASEIETEYDLSRKNALLRGYNDAIREIEIYSLMEYSNESEEFKIMKKLVRHMDKEQIRIKEDMGL